MARTHVVAALAGAWTLSLVPTAAHALSCDEIMLMLDDGLSNEVVIGTLKGSGERISPTTVLCLEERSAPGAVVDVARELAGGFSGSTQDSEDGDGSDWLQDKARKPKPTKPRPAPPPEPPPPPPPEAPPPRPQPTAAGPRLVPFVGTSQTGNAFVKGPVLRGGLRLPLSAALSAEGRISYKPDLGVNDLKDLTHTVVGIAREGSGDVEFQQPVEKNTLRLDALIDLGPEAPWGRTHSLPHLRGGLTFGTYSRYYAVYDDDAPEGRVPTKLDVIETKPRLGTVLEVSQETWTTRDIGVRVALSVRSHVDSKPDYDPDPGNQVTERQFYHGVSFGIDLMKGVGTR